jgi:hypothetical protein
VRKQGAGQDREQGGDWKSFLACAKASNTNILYLSWDSFDQDDIDDSLSKLESDILKGDEKQLGHPEQIKKLTSQILEFQSRVGLTCVVDLGFVANGVVHTYRETTDWFDKFTELTSGDGDDDDADEEEESLSDSDLDEWATKLASNPRYATGTRRLDLFQEIAGAEVSKLPAYRILQRAEMIYRADFKQLAEEKLAAQILELQNQGLNMKAIGMKLDMSQGRVSALASLAKAKKKVSD